MLGKDRLDARDRALFLIDLRDPARHMQRIPIPPQLPPALFIFPAEVPAS